MGLTNFPNGISSMGVPVVGQQGFMTQGKSFFLNPRVGADGNTGLGVDKPLDTLATALSKLTADQNDVVYFMGADNSSSGCTDYQSSTLDWNIDFSHIIGVNGGNMISQRSRIALISTYVTASNLMTVSANCCSFQNLQFFAGVADANPTGCLNVTGDRNHFVNCHIAGIGHASMDIAGAYSLRLSGSENLFDGCVIGLDTIGRGSAANSELLLAGGGARNVFRNCYFITYADAATHQFVIKAASGIDRFVLFENCTFINAVDSGATTMTEAFSVTAGGSPNGHMILKDCAVFGCTDIENAASGEVLVLGHTATAADQSVGGDAAPS